METDLAIAMDRELIQRLGGAAKVAEMLGFEKKGGVQRVHNWSKRGIPAAIKLAHLDLFLTAQRTPELADAPTDKAAA